MRAHLVNSPINGHDYSMWYYLDYGIFVWVMLTGAVRVLVNNLFLESFDTTFMRNEKNC